jgi:hypothetical protein
MSTITWNLSVAPFGKPEYWLLFVDGFAHVSLHTNAPYSGLGKYSADLTQLDTPLPPGSHALSVALVGNNSIGPQSPAVQMDSPVAVIADSLAQEQVDEMPIAWPAGDTVSAE